MTEELRKIDHSGLRRVTWASQAETSCKLLVSRRRSRRRREEVIGGHFGLSY